MLRRSRGSGDCAEDALQDFGHESPYRPELDGLRCLAATLVPVSHLPFIIGLPGWDGVKWAASALRAGYLGVDVFFVLSAFLITRRLLSE